MELAAVLDLLTGSALAWFSYEQRAVLGSPDAWLAVGTALLAALMLLSAAAIVAGAGWGSRMGQLGSGIGLLVGTAALAVGAVLLIGGDVGGGAAKALVGLALLLVFAVAFWVNRTPSEAGR